MCKGRMIFLRHDHLKGCNNTVNVVMKVIME